MRTQDFSEPADDRRMIGMRRVERPWGWFDRYSLNKPSTVKILTLRPGERTSLQSHSHRKELWVALDHGLFAEIGKRMMVLRKGSTVMVGTSVRHRLGCKGKSKVRVLEISFGSFSERDIMRYEDDYGRKTKGISTAENCQYA